MKRFFLSVFLLLFTTSIYAQRYVFFLHNMFLEDAGINGVHPEYGKSEYYQILDSFKAMGFIVKSELRAKKTDGVAYANKIARQIDDVIAQGAKPSNITVVGTSKGGYIAQYVSCILQNTQINYVFIGSCGDYLKDEPKLDYYGNILSIYEKTDKYGSCKKLIPHKKKKVKHFKEIELNTGLKHGFLYKALPGWIGPAAKWANGQYD